MNTGKLYEIFKQIESDKYIATEKLIAIDYVVHLKSHNVVTKDEILRAFKWFLDSEEPVIQNSWIPVRERLPEESLDSVIGWDAYRKRCCFVQYFNGRFVLGNGEDIVNIVAWMPLPEPYKEEK